MSTRDQAVARFTGLLGQVGQAALSVQFPRDFEYYVMMLELLDSRNSTVDAFVFPVMPQTIAQVNTKITNIKQTEAGVVSLTTPTFIPQEINIQGNFGKKFRFLQGGNLNAGVGFAFAPGLTSAAAFATRYLSQRRGQEPPQFSQFIKTGFGCVKILERLHNLSTSLDQYSQPHRLLLYNMAFGQTWLVESMTFRTTQNLGQNMIWGYEMSFRLIADANMIRNNRQIIQRTMTRGVLQRAILRTGAQIKQSLLSGRRTNVIFRRP